MDFYKLIQEQGFNGHTAMDDDTFFDTYEDAIVT